MTGWFLGAAFVLLGVLVGLSAMQMQHRMSWPDRLRGWLAGRQAVFAIGMFVAGVTILVRGISKH